MQPENDIQAVRRVLARAGVTAAALTLALGAAAPAAFAHGGGAAASEDHGSQADVHGHSSGHSNGHGSGHSNAGGSTSGDNAHDPAGNNGTVKIHDVAGDLSHHNVPHVDCDFWVPMWGFDADQSMTVSFAGQAPTGKDQPVSFTAPDGYTLTSTTPAGGGNDYDGELGFSTTAESLQSQLGAPQPQQGYHIKMTVATGAPGGYKYKVFWINCPATSGGQTGGSTGGETGGQTGGSTGGETGGNTGGETGGNTGGETGGSTGGETGGTTGGHPGGGTVAGETGNQSHVGTAVLGEKLTRATPGGSAGAAAAAAPAASSLPFTGAEIGGLAAAAAAAIGGGGFLLFAGRRRRHVGAHR